MKIVLACRVYATYSGSYALYSSIMNYFGLVTKRVILLRNNVGLNIQP